MVSQKNVLTVKDVAEQIKKYPVIGILDMFKLPASQLHQIRSMLRGKAAIRMVKKRLILLALKDSGLNGVEALGERLQGEPALIMTEMNPFKLSNLIAKSKSEAPAKPGDISPRDIMVTAGPTSLPPGPVIGELQKAKIPASIEGDKIHVKQDTIVAKEGDEIGGLLAGVLAKLGITPMEIGLNLIAAWEKGTVYEKDILFIPPEKYVQDLVSAHRGAFNLAISIGYPTSETMPLLLSKAHQQAHSLAMAADILTKDTVKPLLAKANAQAQALQAQAKIPEPEAQSEEAKPEEKEQETAPEAATKEDAPQEKTDDNSKESTEESKSEDKETKPEKAKEPPKEGEKSTTKEDKKKKKS
jgi:large subunit ribosomal protein L10